MANMSVEETHVKQEPEELASNETAEMLYTYQVPIKFEIDYVKEETQVKSEPLCGNGAGVNDAGLYTDHTIKDELVVGPERVQSPCPVATSVTLESNHDASESQNTPSTSDQTQASTASSLIQVKYKNDSVLPPLNHQSLQARYVCDICQKEFARTDLLRIHKRTHTGDKPYSCNICKREFAQLAHLKGHVMIHTGEKPYPCKECPMGFRQLSSLKRHERSHAGEKPHSCNICGKRFTRKGHVAKHKMSRHKEGA